VSAIGSSPNQSCTGVDPNPTAPLYSTATALFVRPDSVFARDKIPSLLAALLATPPSVQEQQLADGTPLPAMRMPGINSSTSVQLQTHAEN